MIFLTEHEKNNSDTPRIISNNWDDAEFIANLQGVKVIGTLVSEEYFKEHEKVVIHLSDNGYQSFIQ